MVDEQDDTMNTQQSFLDERSVGSPAEDGHGEDVIPEESELEAVNEEDMARSFSGPSHTTEHNVTQANAPAFTESVKPKSILKASRAAVDTPVKAKFSMGADWTEQLQRTVSPKKQNRQALRESQAMILKERHDIDVTPKPVMSGNAFATSIDLMNSLFGQSTTRQTGMKQAASRKGFEVC